MRSRTCDAQSPNTSRVDFFAAVNGFAGLARMEDPDFLDRLRLAQQSGVSVPDQALTATFRVLQGTISVIGFVGTLLVLNPALAVAVALAAVPGLFIQLSNSKRRNRMMWRTSSGSRRMMAYRMLMTDQHAAQEVRLFGLGDFLRRNACSANCARSTGLNMR